MDRRTYLKTLAAAGAAGALPAAAAQPIQLHVDLDVDPAKEQDLLGNYRTKFRPAIVKQPGFIEVKLMKLESAVAGKAPPNVAYRLLLSFQTEDQRKAWVATPAHQKVWPTIQQTLRGPNVNAVLFQVIG
jgi:antibiotic biosynthesis monooxygenase (ABM) superfamily enzyme